jgi:hypothetical protein
MGSVRGSSTSFMERWFGSNDGCMAVAGAEAGTKGRDCSNNTRGRESPVSRGAVCWPRSTSGGMGADDLIEKNAPLEKIESRLRAAALSYRPLSTQLLRQSRKSSTPSHADSVGRVASPRRLLVH